MRRFLVWAGLFGTVSSVPILAQTDPRLPRLKAFLEAYESPISNLAADFLAAADRHHLDYRLLPSIALVESGAGKNCASNNIFGWNSGRSGFATAREAIHAVAYRLAHSPLYRGKSVDAILATYNRRPEYAAKVRSVMRRVDPREPAPALAKRRTLTESAELRQPAHPE